MFGCINQRFLCFAAAGVQAAVFQPVLMAQVQVSGSATHYRSLSADLNAGDEYLNILGMGTDPADGVTFIVCSTGAILDCPSSDQIHIYRHNTASNQWEYESSIDHLGFVNQDIVAVDGGTVVFGRTFGQAFGNDGLDIYKRNPGGAWIHEGAILPADNFPGNQFGKSVSIDGDRIAVGAPKDDPDDATHAWEGKGSVYIYDRVGSTWSLTEKVSVPDGEQGDEFGESVAIQNTASGWKLVVGSPDHSTDTGGINQAGAIYAFMNTGPQWVQTDKVVVTTNQNDIGSFGDNGIGFDGEVVAAINFSDIHLYEMDAQGLLSSVASQSGTDYIVNPVVVNREIIIGDPYGDLVSSAGQPNVSHIYENPGGIWVIGQIARPAVFQDGDSYARSVAFNGGVFLAGAPLYDGAGPNSGGIWSHSMAGFAYPTGLIVEGQADPLGEFGRAVVADDTWAFVGVPNSINACDPGTSGAVRVYRLLSGQWSMVDTLLPLTNFPGDEFGSALAFDGNRLVVSMPGYFRSGSSDHFGGVVVFEYVGFEWVATQVIEGNDTDQGFGRAVALSGNHLAIGMPDASAGGWVGLYELDANSDFQIQTNLTSGIVSSNAGFGATLSMMGDNLLVGAPNHNGGEGYVSAWSFDSQSGSWVSSSIAPAASIVAGSRFGTSIDQTADFAFVGIPGDALEPGRVAAYPRAAQGYGQPIMVAAPPSASSMGFGASIAVKDNMLIVGHDDPATSEAHFMAYNGSSYQMIQTVSIPSGDSGAGFGSSMAFGAQTMFVGAFNDDNNAVSNAGAVHLYETEIRFTVPECDMDMESQYIQWIQDDAPNQGERFANSVEVDEGYAIVGAPFERYSFIHDGTVINGNNAGKATIFERTGLNEWTPVACFRGGNFDDPIGISHADWMGWSVDIEKTTAVAGAIQGRYEQSPGTTGSIRVYERTPAGWLESGEIFPPGVTKPGNPIISRYGTAVDLDTTANFIAVGADNSRIGATGTGAGFVLERTPGGWVSTDALVSPTVLFGDHIGVGASVEEGWAAFGAPDDDTNGGSSGSVHLFKRTGLGIWLFHSTIFSPTPHQSAQFGSTLEISRSDLGLTMVVGASSERENNVSGVGAGHVFVLDQLNDQWNSIQRLLPELVTSSVLYGRDISIDHNTIAVGAPFLRDSEVAPSIWTGGVELYNLDRTSGQFVRRTTIRPEISQLDSPNGWGSAIGLSGGTVFLGTNLADGDPYDFANRNFNYGAVTAHDIICIPDCPADINGDGLLDFLDISAFLSAFGNQDAAADLNGDGAFDFLDISAFLSSFAAGC